MDDFSDVRDRLPPARRKRGRPSKYSHQLGASICYDLANGKAFLETLKAHGIGFRTAYDWEENIPEFAQGLAAARAIRADAFADEIKEILDYVGRDLVEIETGSGNTKTVPNPVAAQRDRLRVDTRRWLMERWHPKHYAPRSKVELGGPGGGPILLEQITMLAMQQIDSERQRAIEHPPASGDSDENSA